MAYDIKGDLTVKRDLVVDGQSVTGPSLTSVYSTSGVTQYKIVKVTGQNASKIDVDEVASVDDVPAGIITDAISATSTGTMLRYGVVTVTGLDTQAASVNDPVFFDATGSLTLSDSGSSQVGTVIGLAANGIILVNTMGGVSSSSFSDSSFKIYDDSDSTKTLNFEVSGVTTGNTVTVEVDDNGIVDVVYNTSGSVSQYSVPYFSDTNGDNVVESPFVFDPANNSLKLSQYGASTDAGAAPGQYALDLVTWKTAANHGAGGDLAVAIGGSVSASGNRCVAIGYEATAGVQYGAAIGYSSSQSGGNGGAIGYSARATGSNSFAGPRASASGAYTVALGVNSVVAGGYGVGIGTSATAAYPWSIALGGYSTTRNKMESAIMVACPEWNITGSAKLQTRHSTPTGITTDATADVPLIINQYGSETSSMVLLDGYQCNVSGTAQAWDTGSTNDDHMAWSFEGVASRPTGGTITLDGTITETSNTAALDWDFSLQVDTVNNFVQPVVTGEAGKTIRWSCSLNLDEVAK